MTMPLANDPDKVLADLCAMHSFGYKYPLRKRMRPLIGPYLLSKQRYGRKSHLAHTIQLLQDKIAYIDRRSWYTTLYDIRNLPEGADGLLD